MLTEEDQRVLRDIRENLKRIKDEDIVRDITAIIEIAEVYLLKSEEK